MEDTEISFTEIFETFGETVANLVFESTHTSSQYKGSMNRAQRKAIDHDQNMSMSREGKQVRLSDIIANMSDWREADPDFIKVYMAEKETTINGYGAWYDEQVERGDVDEVMSDLLLIALEILTEYKVEAAFK